MWPEHRRAADRHGLRYPSDLSNSEWALIEPVITPAKRGWRRREVNVREVLNAIFYVLSTGCQWQALPKDLPPKSTAHSYFMLWDWDGTLERSITRSISRPASARRARRLRSSTARAPRALKKGLRA
jgi:transposase